jgi:hypothetical protein
MENSSHLSKGGNLQDEDIFVPDVDYFREETRDFAIGITLNEKGMLCLRKVSRPGCY